MPFTGSMNMFFQTSALTVGMTKDGAITRMRTIPCPPERLIEQERQQHAENDSEHEDVADDHQRRLHAWPERARSGDASIILDSDPVEAPARWTRRASEGSG